jgi:hypothetical protein
MWSLQNSPRGRAVDFLHGALNVLISRFSTPDGHWLLVDGAAGGLCVNCVE